MPDLTVAASVLTWLGQHPALRVSGVQLPVALEDLPASAPVGVMLQTLVGDPYIKRYKSGGHLAAHPFAVYLRVRMADTASRLDALGLLGNLGASIDDSGTWPVPPTGYDFTSLVLRTTPARVAVDDAETEDYQLTLELTYRKRG